MRAIILFFIFSFSSFGYVQEKLSPPERECFLISKEANEYLIFMISNIKKSKNLEKELNESLHAVADYSEKIFQCDFKVVTTVDKFNVNNRNKITRVKSKLDSVKSVLFVYKEKMENEK